MPTVALGSDFLDAYARIPRAQQRKVRDFTEKFKANPKSPGINYEKIHDVRDDKVRTVRIDQKYRAVVLHPGQGDVYILAWVDNHDEAMAWARNRVFEINPVTAATLSRQHGLLATDAVILALMQAHGLTHLASHDAHFDSVLGITRYAPA